MHVTLGWFCAADQILAAIKTTDFSSWKLTTGKVEKLMGKWNFLNRTARLKKKIGLVTPMWNYRYAFIVKIHLLLTTHLYKY